MDPTAKRTIQDLTPSLDDAERGPLFSAAMHEIHMQQRFAADPERVFAAVTDHARMGEWLDGATVTIDRPGNPAPNGLGAVRKISARGLNIYEEIVRWEVPRAMDYHVLRGAPLRDHLGEIRLEKIANGGTQLDYRIRFRVPWYMGGALLGSLVARQLKGEIDKGLAKLAVSLR